MLKREAKLLARSRNQHKLRCREADIVAERRLKGLPPTLISHAKNEIVFATVACPTSTGKHFQSTPRNEA
jgi:hypothetical protein